MDHSPFLPIRHLFRTVTGYSFTAFRTTLRTMTGISISTIYMTTMAMTNRYIRQILTSVISCIPSSLRYFLQPILILYYVPLFLLQRLCEQYGTGSHQKQQQLKQQQLKQQQHDDALLHSWKQAVMIADETLSYWPIHVVTKTKNDTNYTTTTATTTNEPLHDHDYYIEDVFYQDMSELNPIDAIIESIEVASEIQQQTNNSMNNNNNNKT
jgi:hypothetical protein